VVTALEQLVGGHRELQTRNGRACGDRARGDHDIVTGVVLGIALGVGHADRAGRGDEGRAAQEVDLRGLEERFDAGGQLLRDLALVGKNFLNVGADVLGVHADVRAVLGVVIDLGGVEQRLGGDAAAVQAGAACLALFHNGGLEAQLRCAQCRFIAAGTCADDDELIIRHSISFLFRAMPPFSGGIAGVILNFSDILLAQQRAEIVCVAAALPHRLHALTERVDREAAVAQGIR